MNVESRRIDLYDEEDNCTYTLAMSLDDMLTLWNMPIIKKSFVNLPSIDGTAMLRNGIIMISRAKREHERETISVRVEHVRCQIDAAIQSDRDE